MRKDCSCGGLKTCFRCSGSGYYDTEEDEYRPVGYTEPVKTERKPIIRKVLAGGKLPTVVVVPPKDTPRVVCPVCDLKILENRIKLHLKQIHHYPKRVINEIMQIIAGNQILLKTRIARDLLKQE